MAQGRDKDEGSTLSEFMRPADKPSLERTRPAEGAEVTTECEGVPTHGSTLPPTDPAEPTPFTSPDDTMTYQDPLTELAGALAPIGAPGPGDILFGRYVVIQQLGKGGMGTVWLVKHLEFDSERALKLIDSGIDMDAQSRARFKREARIMDRLSHPNAVRVYDARLGEGTAFIEMEHIRGESLNKLITPGQPMPLDEVVSILDQLCSVLQAANDEGIIHRDLKPSNLMLVDGRVPGRKTLKLLDFGIAKIRDNEESEEFKTVPGLYIGTVTYSSPEQIRGDEVDTRSDLYSVGVLLYELLTGFRPFSGTANTLLANHLFATPPSFAEKNPNAAVPPEVEQVVMACLAKVAADRPQSPHELAERFHQALKACGSEESACAASPGTDKSSLDPKIDPIDPDGLSEVGTFSKERRGGLGRMILTATFVLAILAVVLRYGRPIRSPEHGPIPESNPNANSIAPGTDGKAAGAFGLRPPGANPEIETQEALWTSQGLKVDPHAARSRQGWPNALIRSPEEITYRLHPESGIYRPDGYSPGKELDPEDRRPLVLTRKQDEAKFVRIAGGTFLMGCLDDTQPADDPSRPAHPVTLSTFYIQTTEVTNGEIEDYLRDKSPESGREWLKRFLQVKTELQDDELARNHPAVNVPYPLATAYARKRGGRLPTEAQWEFAARSRGKKLPYVWSDKEGTNDKGFSELANIASTGRSAIPTTAVGIYRFDVTVNGVMDLTGNVKEMCRDVSRSYEFKSKPEVDPQFPPDPANPKDAKLVLRGGSFQTELDCGRTTYRGESLVWGAVANDIGFRIVLECPELPPAR